MGENGFAGVVLMKLSKAFDCTRHDLLIGKLHAYGFSEKTFTFFYSYFKSKKQNVKIENFIWRFIWRRACFATNPLQLILNDLLATLKMAELYNFSGDNTISTASKIMNNLIHTLEKESEATAE